MRNILSMHHGLHLLYTRHQFLKILIFFSVSLILLLLPVPRMTRKAAGRNATP